MKQLIVISKNHAGTSNENYEHDSPTVLCIGLAVDIHTLHLQQEAHLPEVVIRTHDMVGSTRSLTSDAMRRCSRKNVVEDYDLLRLRETPSDIGFTNEAEVAKTRRMWSRCLSEAWSFCKSVVCILSASCLSVQIQ
ncbi:hypothetical protein BaRGS_00008373 [Batillaria attramentaria]|uniref:Uncharacterized protein n=1 Tax=Batillaria attramentaria TaxID=370345 RepID=A0ABD0LMH6_9CAEN